MGEKKHDSLFHNNFNKSRIVKILVSKNNHNKDNNNNNNNTKNINYEYNYSGINLGEFLGNSKMIITTIGNEIECGRETSGWC